MLIHVRYHVINRVIHIEPVEETMRQSVRLIASSMHIPSVQESV